MNGWIEEMVFSLPILGGRLCGEVTELKEVRLYLTGGPMIRCVFGDTEIREVI